MGKRHQQRIHSGLLLCCILTTYTSSPCEQKLQERTPCLKQPRDKILGLRELSVTWGQGDTAEGCWCPTMSSEPAGLNRTVASWGVQETRGILFCVHPLNVYKLIFILFYFMMKLSARCRIDGVRRAHT